MSRRVSLPGADELFRPSPDETDPAETTPGIHAVQEDEADDDGARRSSGRVRHDEKMTVYVTADELFELETARLSLRREHGVAVDRGRLVREALAIVLSDLDELGADSQLARRLAPS
ncbi:MAG: hypothetical protein H0U47_10880 [Nocardioidaceae bacterium]|nr:hypothetical protein [Nocardioidaceae bacterium]